MANNTHATVTPKNAASGAPLFTDFTSANLGIPRNNSNPLYFQNVPDQFGFPRNPAGAGFTDWGVGSFLRSQNGIPEVGENLSKKLGDLGLTDKEVDKIVAFLKTLTDGYTRTYADANTYTGACPK